MISQIIEIASENAFLSSEDGFLIVKVDGSIVGKSALDDIGGLTVRGFGSVVSVRLLERLSERNVPVVICGDNQSPSCVVWPVSGHYAQGFVMQAQAVAKLPVQKLLWAQLVSAKIRSQAEILRLCELEFSDLRSMASRVKSGDTENLEAQAARKYWPRLMGEDFRRDQAEAGVNSALNYGYAILRAASARSILTAGLHPSLSIHHQSRGDALRLADDLMEPFRPLVDVLVWRMLRSRDFHGELNPVVKKALVSVLDMDMKTSAGVSPVQVCFQRLANSLSEVYLGRLKKLSIPAGPV